MRVLCFTNMFPTTTEPWAGSFVRELVESVRGLGVHVDVLAFDGRERKRAYAEAALMLRRALRSRRFDLVHAHYGLTGMVALAQRSVPTVVTFHGSDTGNPRVKWQAFVSWIVARRTTPIFVSSDGARRLGCTGAAVIPAGVDLDLFRPRPMEQARRSLGWPVRGRFVLLPGARTNPDKGAGLFDAVVEELRPRVPRLTAVALEGYSREQVVDVMNAVDVTLLTSVFEGSPVSAKESLACMTPVVSVPVGDMRELLAGLPGCAVAPRDPVSLANAVLAALESGSDPTLRHRAEQYSNGKLAEEVVALYRGVITRNVA
jgi:glycosyltransferase involved in cell wall biosynthesis